MTAQRWAEAAESCRRAHGGGDQVAGVAAVRALAKLGRLDEAQSLAGKITTAQRGPALIAVADEFVSAGKSAQALARYEEALPLLERAGAWGEAAYAAHYQALIHWRNSQLAEALAGAATAVSHADRSKKLTKRVGARLLLSSVSLSVGDAGAARAALEQIRQLAATVDAAQEIEILQGEVEVLDAEGNSRATRALLERIVSLAELQRDRYSAWSARHNLLSQALNQPDLGTARDMMARLERSFRDEGFADREPSRRIMNFHRARLAAAEGRFEEARPLFEALAAAERIPDRRWRIELELGRVWQGLRKPAAAEAAYRRAMEDVSRLRDQARQSELKGWVVAERRAPQIALLDLLARQGRSEDALAVLERDHGNTFVETLTAGASSFSPPSGADGAGTRRVQSLLRLGQTLRDSARAKSALGTAFLPRLADRQVLWFLEAEDRLRLVAVRRGRLRIWTIPEPLPALRRDLRAFIADPGDAALATRLHGSLFPEGALPERSGVLFVVPSPSLVRVPLTALRRDGRALIESQAISLVPSLSALLAIERSTPPSSGPVIVADAHADLPGARVEGEAVARQLGGAGLFLGSAATSRALLGAGSASLLHLAVHSGLDAQGAWLGFADRRVYARELVERRIGPAVLVLASCSSAAARDPERLGSLFWSSLAAGARSVVGTLWSVNDRASVDFIRRFYELGGATEPVRALARAQREWAQAGAPATDWAAFVVGGTSGVPDRGHKTLVAR